MNLGSSLGHHTCLSPISCHTKKFLGFILFHQKNVGMVYEQRPCPLLLFFCIGKVVPEGRSLSDLSVGWTIDTYLT